MSLDACPIPHTFAEIELLQEAGFFEEPSKDCLPATLLLARAVGGVHSYSKGYVEPSVFRIQALANVLTVDREHPARWRRRNGAGRFRLRGRSQRRHWTGGSEEERSEEDGQEAHREEGGVEAGARETTACRWRGNQRYLCAPHQR